MPAETGIVWVPVEHDGCAQSSDEECDAIVAMVEELLGRRVVDRDGVERAMTPGDILIVAPFNVQVRCLRDRLGPAHPDRLGGQVPGAGGAGRDRLALRLDPGGGAARRVVPPEPQPPQRGRVAGARRSAIVVGCPELMDVRCRSVEEMRLVNLLCHLVQYAEEANGVTVSP